MIEANLKCTKPTECKMQRLLFPLIGITGMITAHFPQWWGPQLILQLEQTGAEERKIP